jgi:hypothetical protein
LLFLIAGIGLSAYSTQESFIEESVLEKWDPKYPRTLEPPPSPNNSTLWGRLMKKGWWFELNMSSSAPVRLTVSVIEHQDGPTMVPIFNQTGTFFNQEIKIGGTGTYQIDITNEGNIPADIWGNVTAKVGETRYHVVYPYVVLGIPMVIGGMGALVFGVVAKTKKRLKPLRIDAKRRR